MIKEISDANNNVTANGYELNKLKQALPQCFTSDGSFNMEAFKAILDGNVNVANESYELKFLGKSYARLLASLDTETIIVPNEEHNNKPENINSENVYITGDNLDALKHLLKSYEGKVKCIYIDPPYNTGSDGFVYNDKFSFTKDELVRKLSIDEEQAERILDLTNRGSSSHSAWLTFMFPRLLLARDILSNAGAIFISIDDNEYANLKLICDSIFGEQNFVASIVVENDSRVRPYDSLSITHELMLVYRKSENSILNVLSNTDKKFQFHDEEGGFDLYELRNRNSDFNATNRPNLYYPFWVNEKNCDENGLYEIDVEERDEWIKFYPQESKGIKTVWRWGKDKAKENLNKVIFARKSIGGWQVVKKYRGTSYSLSSVWNNSEFSSDRGTLEVKSLFGDRRVFAFPKPISLIKQCLQLSCDEESIVLDFFSGSGTTAEAVMKHNVFLGTSCRFVLVQLCEKCDVKSEAYKAGYETIDQIGRERIIRAAAKIKEECPETTADLGFKHYVLQDVPEKKLIELEDFDPDAMFAEEKILEYFTKPTVLTTWLVKDGYGFNAKVEELKLADYTAYYCDNHLYFLDTDFDDEAMKALYEKYDAEISFKPENVVIFGYSFTYTQTALLKDNLKKLKAVEDNKNVNVIVRY